MRELHYSESCSMQYAAKSEGDSRSRVAVVNCKTLDVGPFENIGDEHHATAIDIAPIVFRTRYSHFLAEH